MAAEKIFLIGMMGSGKSFWTKKISKWIKSGGYDLDALIEMLDAGVERSGATTTSTMLDEYTQRFGD